MSNTDHLPHIPPWVFHMFTVLWLIVPTGLVLYTGNANFLLLIVPLFALLYIRDRFDILNVQHVAIAAAVVAFALLGWAVNNTWLADPYNTESIKQEVEDNTEAIRNLDTTAAAAADIRQRIADDENEPIAGPCDLALASLDQLRYVGGLPVTPDGDDRLHIITTLASALVDCHTPDDGS